MVVLLSILRPSHQNDVDSKLLKQLLQDALDQHLPEPKEKLNRSTRDTRNGRQIQSADPGAIMYLPIGGGGNIR